MTGSPGLEILDCHCGGDVSRVILSGVTALPGEGLADQAAYLGTSADGLRKLLLSEPYGNPTMSVDLLVPPKAAGADAGVIIMEAMGYPGFSGSNAICTAKVCLENSGRILADGSLSFVLETPGALVPMTARCRGGQVVSVSYKAPPAFVAEESLSADLPGFGALSFDLVWGGVFYALVKAEDLELALTREDVSRLAEIGAKLVESARPHVRPQHFIGGNAGPLSFVLFVGGLKDTSSGALQARQAAYVHPGVICRSPTGTGTAAHLAWLAKRGEVAPGSCLESLSPFGTGFQGKILGAEKLVGCPAIATEIGAQAFALARSRVFVDFSDQLVAGEGLQSLLLG